MFLRKKIKASSIAEVVIAISVIALCFGIASLIFVRLTMVSTNFQTVKKQTEIQSMIWKQMQNNYALLEHENVQLLENIDQNNDSILVYTYSGFDNKIIWQQQSLIND